jgi:hypothetical protein
MTWILLIVVLNAKLETAVAVVPIPGYATEQQCLDAGVALAKETLGHYRLAPNVGSTCFPGPKAP